MILERKMIANIQLVDTKKLISKIKVFLTIELKKKEKYLVIDFFDFFYLIIKSY